MMRVAFVCLGNICRSPMAELVFKAMVGEAGLSDKISVESFGTSDEEAGNPIYPPARAALAARGITGTHIARKITYADIVRDDYIIGMDSSNVRALKFLAGNMSDKVYKLCDFTTAPRDIIDPWYSRDFEKTLDDIEDGCRGLLKFLSNKL